MTPEQAIENLNNRFVPMLSELMVEFTTIRAEEFSAISELIEALKSENKELRKNAPDDWRLTE